MNTKSIKQFNEIFSTNENDPYHVNTEIKFYCPQPNGWKYYLCGYGTSYPTYFCLMDNVRPPCWFHRRMSKLILGIVWTYNDEIR